jgi:hypothetical protein
VMILRFHSFVTWGKGMRLVGGTGRRRGMEIIRCCGSFQFRLAGKPLRDYGGPAENRMEIADYVKPDTQVTKGKAQWFLFGNHTRSMTRRTAQLETQDFWAKSASPGDKTSGVRLTQSARSGWTRSPFDKALVHHCRFRVLCICRVYLLTG